MSTEPRIRKLDNIDLIRRLIAVAERSISLQNSVARSVELDKLTNEALVRMHEVQQVRWTQGP